MLIWLVPALLPASILLFFLYRSDARREPVAIVLLTFFLGAVAAGFAVFVEHKAAHFTGLDIRTQVAGQAGAILFLFAVVAPVREAAKVAACWPAFRSQHFDEPYDGLVYSGAAALGFAVIENAITLRAGHSWLSVARTLLALPAHLFFASAWGYGLGRAKQSKIPAAHFPIFWAIATLGHAFYIHFIYGRGPSALVAAVPLLLVMGAITWFAARDLHLRGESRTPLFPEDNRLSIVPSLPPLPTITSGEIREAFRHKGQPILVGWVLLGAICTMGAMLLGLGASIALGAVSHIDFSPMDEEGIPTLAPVALLGSGLLAAFPLSGYLIAKAARLRSLLEPALASALALAISLALLGLTAPIAIMFALAMSPIAWALSCLGAWVGRRAD